MSAQKKPVSTMDEYIKACPDDVQRILEKIRQTIRRAAPEAIETISYGMPTFKLDGTYLVYFAAYKNHIGFYPLPLGNEALKELAPYQGPKGAVRLPIDEPIPYDLVRKMVLFRLKEHRAKKNSKGDRS